MDFKQLKFKGVFEIQLKPREDHRGFFMRVYDEKIFTEHGIHCQWVQENHSLSVEKGTLRGMHFQFSPYTETKLVRVVSGAMLDVFLDLRKDSATFGQWDSLILSGENKKALYIPKGMAHGFCTLSDHTQVIYKVDAPYAPKHEGAIRWDDPDLKIEWPTRQPILSDKDKIAMDFKTFKATHRWLEE